MPIRHHCRWSIPRALGIGEDGSRLPASLVRPARRSIESGITICAEKECATIRQQQGGAYFKGIIPEKDWHIGVAQPLVQGRNVAFRDAPAFFNREYAVIGQLHPTRLIQVRILRKQLPRV